MMTIKKPLALGIGLPSKKKMPWDQGPGLRCPGDLVPGFPSKFSTLSKTGYDRDTTHVLKFFIQNSIWCKT